MHQVRQLDYDALGLVAWHVRAQRSAGLSRQLEVAARHLDLLDGRRAHDKRVLWLDPLQPALRGWLDRTTADLLKQ